MCAELSPSLYARIMFHLDSCDLGCQAYNKRQLLWAVCSLFCVYSCDCHSVNVCMDANMWTLKQIPCRADSDGLGSHGVEAEVCLDGDK